MLYPLHESDGIESRRTTFGHASTLAMQVPVRISDIRCIWSIRFFGPLYALCQCLPIEAISNWAVLYYYNQVAGKTLLPYIGT